jgi:hypothetical protein
VPREREKVLDELDDAHSINFDEFHSFDTAFDGIQNSAFKLITFRRRDGMGWECGRRLSSSGVLKEMMVMMMRMSGRT